MAIGEGSRDHKEIAPVLIVEDDCGQRLTLCDILEREGFSTLECGSGEKALEIARREQIAVAIVDYNLPGISGVETLEDLREHDPMIRVIIHTAYGSFSSAKSAVNLGAFAYVEKPSDPAEMVRCVGRAVRRWMGKALHKSQIMLRLLDSALDQANLPVSVTTSATGRFEARFVYVNPAFTRMTGYSKEELIGREPKILYGSKTKRSVLDRQRHLMDQGRSFVGEMVHYRKDGRQFFMETRLDPVRDGDGAVTHWVAIYR
ncbi:MAG: response regulator [bacterium]|nr:response regulator [bacterium]